MAINLRSSDEFPMNEHVRLYIEIKDEEIASKYPFDSIKRGKWMLFVSNKHMNDMWQKALRLYRAGELTGIISIKTSTAASNPRAAETKTGAIRFACGPSDDEDKVLTYGRNVVAKMGYYSDRGYIAYKTDLQTAKGTRATGAKRNFHYRITVPTQKPTQKSKNTETNRKMEIPSRTWSNEWLHEIADDIALQHQLDRAKLGRWSLTFPKQFLDVAWVKACQLYRSNELTGISFLKSTTAKPCTGKESARTGVIVFFCGPYKDEEAMMKYGRNLVRKMDYRSRYNNLQFKIESHSGGLRILYEMDLQSS